MESDAKSMREWQIQLDKWPKGVDSRSIKGILSELSKLQIPGILVKYKTLAETVKNISTSNFTGPSEIEREVIEAAKLLTRKWKAKHDEESKATLEKKAPTDIPPLLPAKTLDPRRGVLLKMLYKSFSEKVAAVRGGDIFKTRLGEIQKLIIGIEEEVAYRNRESFPKKYEERMKEIIMNMKNHQELPLKVLDGAIDPKYLATCDFMELANPETKKKVEQFMKKVADEADLDKEKELLPSTRDFKCPKCDNDDCLYNEKQTRSADEPSTLFLRCKNCEACWSVEQ